MCKLRVLVIDDSRETLHVMERLVSQHDCQVRTCGDSKRAVAIAKEFMPHVIFLDIVMPELDGFMVAEDLRDLGLPEYLLVALTSHTDEAHRNECAKSGFGMFLAKPISIDQVTSVIEPAKERFLASV
jgi:CheY-like chemotaxis protein